MSLNSIFHKEILNSPKAPAAIGPYSQGIKSGETVYVSGQLPIDAEVGEITGKNIKEQTTQSLKNVQYVLAENNMDLSNVVKTTVLLNDIKDFAEMNEVYAEFFSETFPARATYQVAALPSGALVEIEVIATE